MPSSVEKIIKILKLEAELGYENRAVVGGLEKFLPSWEIEARASKVPDDLVNMVVGKINSYRQEDPTGRSEILKNLLPKLYQAIPDRREHANRPRPQVQANRREFRPPQQTEKHAESHPIQRPPVPEQRPGSHAPTPSSTQTKAVLSAPLTVLQGVGPHRSQSFQALGLKTLEDLLYYFPRRYDDYSKLKPINRLEFGDELTVIGTIHSIASRPLRGGQMQLIEAILTDGTGFLRLTWFNQPYMVHHLPVGTQVVISGKVDMYLGRLVMKNPEHEFLEQEHLHTNRIVPVYPLTARVTQRTLRKQINQVVSTWAPRVQDYLPESILQATGLMELPRALFHIHFPDNLDLLNSARSRLAFDEIFFLQLGVLRQKRAWQMGTAQIFDAPDEWMDGLVSGLPFELTGAQKRVLKDVRSDLVSTRPMNRLLQGDVGSGKTVIAALVIAVLARHNGQSALLAPTSILAEQHYRNMQRLLVESQVLQEGEIRLLIGDTPEAEKREIRQGLEDGTIKLIIGTHALLEDPITFKWLQLAVIDEQHRFGVSQRAVLRSKGENPHLLVMTATPIPRSLALTVYGDLDISVMDEMPAGRLPIETRVFHPRERERAYQLIRNQVDAGRQVFIIYPLVEQGDRDEGKAAVEEHARLQEQIFPHYKLGLLHGRMKPEEKDEIMRSFRDGSFQILVSTSVVEVGVDVPNATVMLIEGAERFGLAQLHQFRGRVGRGDAQSYCILIPDSENALENQRLAAMEETNDGFILAERDLDQRGPGDFLGTRQSGFAELRLANLTDVRLIEKARQQAQALFEIDPELSAPEHAPLVRAFHHFWGNGRGDIS